MPTDRPRQPAQTFFLNEQHELARGEKAGGGSIPKLAPLNWQSKGQHIHQSLGRARETIQRSKDPLRTSRFFLATTPTPKIRKESKDLRRAPEGIVEEPTDYAGEHSRTFRRLGLDLLAVDPQGRALVHAPASRMQQLLSTTESLASEGPRERARWVAIDAFDAAPTSFRIDDEWLASVPAKAHV